MMVFSMQTFVLGSGYDIVSLLLCPHFYPNTPYLLTLLLTVPTDPKGVQTVEGFKQILNFTTAMRSFLYVLGMSLFTIGIAIAGLMRMVAFGNDKRVAMSNQALIAAIIGLIILLLSGPLQKLIETYF